MPHVTVHPAPEGHQLPNLAVIRGWCVRCGSACAIRVDGLDTDEPVYEAGCERHGGQEIEALPEPIVKQARREARCKRDLVVTCFEQ